MHRRRQRSAFEAIFHGVQSLRVDAKRAHERALAQTKNGTSSTLGEMLTRAGLFLIAAVPTVAVGCGAPREPTTVALDRDASAPRPPLEVIGPRGASDTKRTPRSRIEWVDASGEASARDRAVRERRAVLVYFSATWCAACAELERTTFRDSSVIDRATELESIRVDATDDDDPKVTELTKKYRVIGLPTLVILDARGSEVARITEYVTGSRLAAALEKVRP